VGRLRQVERQPPQTSESSPETAVAVALAGSAGASQPAFVLAVAPLLLAFLPRPLLTEAEIASEIAEQAAKLLYEAESVRLPNGGFARTMALEAISYRAAYAKAAVTRLSRAVLDSETENRGEALRKALEAERRHLAAHVEMTRRRMAGAKTTDGMIGLHGWILNWKHGATRTPTEPRPSHKAADGMNVDLRRGIPASLMALPGVLPFCSCAWGPPVAGARMIL
jgi:hypothetical protein